MSGDLDDDPFSRLGIEPAFDMDDSVIESRILRATARLHPDRATDPIQAEEWSRELAAVNEAGRMLLSRERRADALLRLLGGPAASDEKGLPEGFLEQMLATRMELEEAVAAGDQQGVSALETWAREEREHHHRRVADLFNACREDVDPSILVNIRLELNRWRYIERMIEQLHPAPGSSSEVPE